MFRSMVGKEICLLMKAKSKFIKLKGWLASMFTLNSNFDI